MAAISFSGEAGGEKILLREAGAAMNVKKQRRPSVAAGPPAFRVTAAAAVSDRG